MKRYFLLFCFVLPLATYSQSAEEIVGQCVNALGGEKALQKYADYKASGLVSYFRRGSEMKGQLELIRKGNKSWRKIELDFGGRPFVIKSVYDGKTAFSDRNGRIADQPSLNFESDNRHSLLLLLDKTGKLVLDKGTEIDGRKAYGVRIEQDGTSTLFYIDSQDYTVREAVFSDLYFGDNDTKEIVEKRVRYNNYQLIDGVHFPKEMVFLEKGQKKYAYSLTEISFGPEIDNAIFQRPDEDLDLRYFEEMIH